nr:hypothetical protein BaRGS_034341 [Batillaria attramentaria]
MMDMDDGEDQVQHVVNEMVVSVDWDDGFVATSVVEDGTGAMRVVCEVLRRVPGAPSQIEEAYAQLQKQILQQDGTRKGLNRLCRLSRRVKKLFVRQ